MKVYSGPCLLSDCGIETSLMDYLGNPIYSGDMVIVINEKYDYYDNEDSIEVRFENRKEQDMNVVLAKGYDLFTGKGDSQNDWIFG
jgi:hypothetical protein